MVKRWNIKNNEGKSQAIYSSTRYRVPDDALQINEQDIPFVNNVTHLGVTFYRRMTWRNHIKRTVAKVLRTYIRIYSLFGIGLLSTNKTIENCEPQDHSD
jgi:hypothetical protein